MDEFEARLRAFKPRKPAPLPPAATARPAVRLLGAAAAVAAAMLVAIAVAADWRNVGRGLGSAYNEVTGRGVSAVAHDSPAGVVRSFSPAGGMATVGFLTPLALTDSRALDAALNQMSQTLLPDVEQPNHALSALGRNSQ